MLVEVSEHGFVVGLWENTHIVGFALLVRVGPFVIVLVHVLGSQPFGKRFRDGISIFERHAFPGHISHAGISSKGHGSGAVRGIASS